MDPRSIQCLQHSIVTAKNLQRLLASRLHGRLSSLPSCQLPPIPTLELPFPEDIWLSIQKLDLPEQAIERVYQKFVETINNTRQIHIQQYEQGCHRLLESLTSKEQPIKSTLERLCHSFRHSYESKYLPLIRSEILGLTKTNNASRKREKKGTPFNSEYTPLLEKYFEYNAYPSAPDRLVLARKSMMTPRQIEVWFQNHRNRRKREGGTLRRLSCHPLPLKLSLETLEKDMPLFTLPESIQVESSDIASSITPQSNFPSPPRPNPPPSDVDIFSTPAPSHAFPTRFPPPPSINPFPNRSNGFRLPLPEWPRKAASGAQKHRPVIDLNDFVAEFAVKLNFREGRKQGEPAHPSCTPWISPMVTIPCRAPHPALVIPPTQRHSRSAKQLHSICPPCPPLLSSQSPSFPTSFMSSHAPPSGSRASSFCSDSSGYSSTSSSSCLTTPTSSPNAFEPGDLPFCLPTSYVFDSLPDRIALHMKDYGQPNISDYVEI